ncbi:hypothetical protein [Streptomyces chartreusis]
MSPYDHLSRLAVSVRQRSRSQGGRLLTSAAVTVGATLAIALPSHPQSAPASPTMRPNGVAAAALYTSRNAPHAQTGVEHKPRYITSPIAATGSAETPAHPTTPGASAPDSTWGIPTPILAGAIGALIGAGSATLIFALGRRHTRMDRAEDQQREEAREEQLRAEKAEELRRIAARDSWRDLYEDLRTATSNVLTVYLEATERPLFQDDDEAQQIAALLKRLRHAIELARGHRSDGLTDSITGLHGCLTTLQATLLPARGSLTDLSTLELMDLLAQSATQARVASDLGNRLHEARAAVDMEWGNR